MNDDSSALVMVLVVLGMIAAVGFGAYMAYEHPCIKSHEEMVHHEAWLQLLPTGKSFIPITHPAYNAMETVCDERKP